MPSIFFNDLWKELELIFEKLLQKLCMWLWNQVTDLRLESQACPPERNTPPLFVCLISHMSFIYSVSRALEGIQRTREIWTGREERNCIYITQSLTKLPQAFSCIILTLQCAEKDILLSSNKNRFESHQTLNSQNEEICHYRHLS